ncbi:ergosterol biosynthesis protein [Teratosphaeriaceae sp. CCFEE 6253]|nr:ergosterol biosynthesis protein [Teratosphaeriaceae sp. CCFEE 6253]
MSSALEQAASYLPPSPGLLPKWLLFLSIVSIGNSIQAYVSLKGSREVYAGTSPSQVTPLSARTFGTWTALSSIIRLYAAYHIHEPVVYQLALWTYGLAFAHFFSEWLVFGTAKWGRGLAGPAVISTVSLSWMLAQWGSYVK